jgi:hypothetical protein
MKAWVTGWNDAKRAVLIVADRHTIQRPRAGAKGLKLR